MDEQSGQARPAGPLRDAAAHRRGLRGHRHGVEALASHWSTGRSERARGRGAGDADPAEVARLRAALEEERIANAQLEERVRVLHARGEGRAEAAEAEVARLREPGSPRSRPPRRPGAAELEAVLAELIPLLEEAV